LNISIFDSRLKNITPSGQNLYQSLGDNMYAIELDKNANFKHLQVYTLEVIDEIGEHYYLRFQYIDPYKN
jgi:hypothetical protein